MKHLIGLFCLLFAFAATDCQAQLKQGHKLLKKHKYEQAIKAFEVDVFNNKGDIAVEAEYNLAKIYFTKEYENFDLEKAYQYAKSALKRHEKLSQEETDRIQKKGLGQLMIDNYKRQIVNAAYDTAQAHNSYKDYEYFLRAFDGPTPIQFEKVTIWRNQKGLEEATKLNTWNAYENFYRRYHESCVKFSPDVDTQAQMLMFEAYMKERNWNGFGSFSSTYPDNVYVKDSAASQNFLMIATSSKKADFEKFIIGFPKSRYVKIAVDNIFRLTMQSQNLEEYDAFVRTYPNYVKIKELWAKYYELFLSQNGRNSGEEFLKMYPNAPLKKADINKN